jgi:hypothetical protein
MRRFWFTLTICLSCWLHGQESFFRYQVHYPTNEDQKTVEEMTNIEQLLDSLQQVAEILFIDIASHTDSVGSLWQNTVSLHLTHMFN